MLHDEMEGPTESEHEERMAYMKKVLSAPAAVPEETEAHERGMSYRTGPTRAEVNAASVAEARELLVAEFMEAMLKVQKKQNAFTFNVGEAVAHGGKLDFELHSKQYQEVLDLVEQAEILKTTYEMYCRR
jgi:hypothetical protein